MFGIGPMELIVVAVVAIIFIGPDKLPETMKKIGRFFVQARRHANDVKDTFHQVIHDAEREIEIERIREIQAKIQATSPAQLLDAEIQKANQASHEEDHAPYGAEAYNHAHDQKDHPDFVSMDHFAQQPDPIKTTPVQATEADKPAAQAAKASEPLTAEANSPGAATPLAPETSPSTASPKPNS